MARARRRLVIHGLVQGVFFRGSTAEVARRLAVDGWVRNLQSGAVEAVFEGAPAEVEAAVGYCHRGPAQARVERVEEFDEPAEGLQGFRVLVE